MTKGQRRVWAFSFVERDYSREGGNGQGSRISSNIPAPVAAMTCLLWVTSGVLHLIVLLPRARVLDSDWRRKGKR